MTSKRSKKHLKSKTDDNFSSSISGIYFLEDICLAFLLSSIFFGSAAYYYTITNAMRVRGVIALIVSTAAFGVCLVFLLKTDFVGKLRIMCSSVWFRCGLLTAALAVLLRCTSLQSPTYWDSVIYFADVQKAATFNYSVKDYLAKGNLAAHFSYMYTLPLLVGYYLCPSSAIGVNIVRLILYIPCVFIFSYVLTSLFPKAKPATIFLGTLVVSTCPMQLGTFSALNLDYPLLIFSVYLLGALISGHTLLIFFTATSLILSKEPGIVMVFAALTATALCNISRVRASGERQSAAKAIDGPVIAMAISVVTCGFFYLAVRALGLTWTGQTFSAVAPPAEFRFDARYIAQKLYTMLLFNFGWLYTLIATCGVIAYGGAIRKDNCGLGRRLKEIEILSPLVSYYAAIVAFAAFSCVYVTVNMPRYGLPVETAVALVCAVSILRVSCITKKSSGDMRFPTFLCQATCIGIIALGMVESLVTIDPFTRALGVPIPAGNDKYVYTPQLGNEFVVPEDDAVKKAITFNNGVMDEAIYNGQLLHRDELFNQILYDIAYDNNTDVIIWLDPYMQQIFCSLDGTTILVDQQFDYRTLGLEWDAAEGMRVIPSETTDETIPIRTLNFETFKSAADEGVLRQRAVLIIDPLVQRSFTGQNITTVDELSETTDEIVAELGKYYEVSEPTWVSTPVSTGMCYYELTLRKQGDYR